MWQVEIDDVAICVQYHLKEVLAIKGVQFKNLYSLIYINNINGYIIIPVNQCSKNDCLLKREGVKNSDGRIAVPLPTR